MIGRLLPVTHGNPVSLFLVVRAVDEGAVLPLRRGPGGQLRAITRKPEQRCYFEVAREGRIDERMDQCLCTGKNMLLMICGPGGTWRPRHRREINKADTETIALLMLHQSLNQTKFIGLKS